MRTTKLGAVLASLAITTGTAAVLGAGPAQAATATKATLSMSGHHKTKAQYGGYVGNLVAGVTDDERRHRGRQHRPAAEAARSGLEDRQDRHRLPVPRLRQLRQQGQGKRGRTASTTWVTPPTRRRTPSRRDGHHAWNLKDTERLSERPLPLLRQAHPRRPSTTGSWSRSSIRLVEEATRCPHQPAPSALEVGVSRRRQRHLLPHQWSRAPRHLSRPTRRVYFTVIGRAA